jgi:CMP-N,N'-diacetyllegionaminic acid synthase
MRGGSKGIKNKNLLKILGRDLMFYTINCAKKSKIFKKIVVTSDCKKILNVAKKYNLDNYILRSKKLANDKISKHQSIIDAVKKTEKIFNMKFDYIFDLDVSAPLREPYDIVKAYKKILKEKKKNLITVVKSRRNPYFNMIEKKNSNPVLCKKSSIAITSRQQAPQVFDMNSSIYIWKRNYLFQQKKTIGKNTSIYLMKSRTSFDIDNYLDLEIVKIFLKKNKSKTFKYK